MKVLVAGATGAIGSSLLPQLAAAGHTAVGLTRSERGAARLRAAGVEPVLADVMDGAALLSAVHGLRADAVVHQATAIDGVPQRHRDLYPTDDLREQGTANLLRAAQAVGAHRFVTQSFFLGYGYRDHGDGLLTEDEPFAEPTGHRGFDRHMASMRSNEQQALHTEGIEGIALRYGMFYGPEPATRALADLARRRMLPAPRPGGTTSLIHLHDAASAAVAALEHGRPGQPYNIVDDRPAGFAEYVAAIARHTGSPAPRTVPGWLLRPLPYLHAMMVTTRIRLSNARAKQELGWDLRYPSYEEGLAAT